MRNVKLVDNITNFYYKIVECCIFLKKLYRFCNFQILKKVGESSWHHTSIIFGKVFEIFGKNFFEICTTVYKAGFSKLDDLYNLVSKYITKYPVLTTYKIFKNIKKIGDVFFYIFENFISCKNWIFCDIF